MSMSDHKPTPTGAEVDYGQALRWVRMVRRCLPEAKIHWVEADQTFCQCGQTERLRQAMPPLTRKSWNRRSDENELN